VRRFCLLALLLSVVVVAPAAFADGSPGQQVEGTLRAWHGDTATTPVGVGAGIDTPFAGVLDVPELGPAEIRELVGKRVRAVGVRTGHRIALAGGTGVTATGAVSAAAAVSGTRTVAVVMFNFADNPTVQPWTTATVRSVVFDGTGSVNAYYRDTSYGQLSLAGEVFGPFTIGSSNTGCDWRSWGTQARNAAIASGVPLSGYQHTVYLFPSAPGCGWAGLAYMPGSESWINNALNLRVVAHELGHNFGTHHASTLACGTVVLTASGCSTSEYGDPFTVMGASATKLHTAYARAEFGHLTDTVTVTTGGSHTLSPVDFTGSTLPRQLRIPRGDGTSLYLEFRQPHLPFDNFSSTDSAVNGVLIRLGTGLNTYTQTKLLDAHPGGSFADAAFGAGERLTDPVSGVTITVVSVSPAGAGLTVQFAPDTTPPTAPSGFTATASGTSSVALKWNAATDNSGQIAAYRIARNGVQFASVTSLSYTDSGLTAGTAYSYTVVAVDGAGNVSPSASATATTAVPDGVAPTAPTNLRAQAQNGRKIGLSWNAASDNIGVTGYRVLRNGVQVAQVASLSYRDSPGARGTFSYTVLAVDAAGNVSPPSNVATATV
jgi:chitodextrinase